MLEFSLGYNLVVWVVYFYTLLPKFLSLPFEYPLTWFKKSSSVLQITKETTKSSYIVLYNYSYSYNIRQDGALSTSTAFILFPFLCWRAPRPPLVIRAFGPCSAGLTDNQHLNKRHLLDVWKRNKRYSSSCYITAHMTVEPNLWRKYPQVRIYGIAWAARILNHFSTS